MLHTVFEIHPKIDILHHYVSVFLNINAVLSEFEAGENHFKNETFSTNFSTINSSSTLWRNEPWRSIYGGLIEFSGDNNSISQMIIHLRKSFHTF